MPQDRPDRIVAVVALQHELGHRRPIARQPQAKYLVCVCVYICVYIQTDIYILYTHMEVEA